MHGFRSDFQLSWDVREGVLTHAGMRCSLTSGNITGTKQEKKHTVSQLRADAQDGNLYVLVNTTAFPNGELRGTFMKT